MRPPPRVVAEYGLLIHLSSPQSPPPSSPARCEPHACRWWPYSGSKEFEANAAMVIIILLSALTCALALNAAIRCFLRSSTTTSATPPDGRAPDHHPVILPQTQMVHAQQKSNAAVAPPLESGPTVVYTAGMKTRLVGAEAECAICLSEFVEGEGIRVLPRCKHGFHAQCIQEWLSSHSSCPTCRRTCLPPSPSQSPPPPPPPSTEHNISQEQPPVPESTGP